MSVDKNILASFSYQLGPNGNRLSLTEGTGRVVEYTYDELYRLTTETITDPINGDHLASYQYDETGSRTTSTINGILTNYIYDDNDRLLSAGEVEYDYDDNGNLIQTTEGQLITNHSYNSLGQLIEVDDGQNLYQYQYDAQGIKSQATINGEITEYLIDHNQDYAQVLLETDPDQQIIYTYGDDLLAQQQGEVIYYHHYDGLGSTRMLSDDQAQITDQYHYDAYGNVLAQEGGTYNNYLFTGEQYDPNIGFYYLRARYMNPETGTFTQMDSWPGRMHEPITLNKYLYANADPVN